MPESTPLLTTLLAQMTQRARAAGLSDAQWAARAGVRKETLSRLRGRSACDFATLVALAGAVNVQLGLVESQLTATSDGHFPAAIDREYERRLVELCVSRSLVCERWARLGPLFFMAGLAVMLASVAGYDRRGLLSLAEQLHPGSSEPAVFSQWLERSPLRPSRFLPLLNAEQRHAA